MIIKSQVSIAGEFTPDTGENITFILRLLLNPLVISGMAEDFLASLAWMATLTQFELDFAYPLMTLSFITFLISRLGKS